MKLRKAILNHVYETLKALADESRGSLAIHHVAAEPRYGEIVPDACVDVTVDGRRVSLVLEIKEVLSVNICRTVIGQLDRYVQQLATQDIEAYGIVVADMVPGAIAQQVKESGWGYISTDGDMHLNLKGLYVSWRHSSLPYRAPRSVSDALRGKGVQVGAALLKDPDKEWGLMDLCEKAGVGAAVGHRTKLSLFDLGVLAPTRGKRFQLTEEGASMLRKWQRGVERPEADHKKN